jgi:two-component system, LytTR family, sensor kinase
MKSKPHRQLRPLINAALVTSPVIATLLITPTFLVSGMSATSLERVLIVSSVNVLFVWGLHLMLLKWFPAPGWQRLALAAAVGFVIVAVESRAMNETAPLLQSRFYLIRCINILSINGIVFMISNYILLSQTKKQLDKENDQLKFNNLEARFQVLKNQVNPHFLFNSIGTAKALIRKDPKLADEYLVKLSSILRLGFDHKSDIVTVKEELGFCKDYAQLQQIRFGPSLRFDTAIEEKYLDYVVPCFSLLTLVENAVKHNAMTEEDPLLIGVRNEGDLLIAENNTRQAFVPEYAAGTGLQNLSERYRLLFDAPVKIETEAALFRVTLKMIPA